MLDDLFTYRLADGSFLTVTNAANHEKDLAWFRSQATGFEVEITDRAVELAMLAVQGPAARGLVATPRLGRAAQTDADGDHRGGGCLRARLRDRLHGRGRGRADRRR